MQIICVDLQKDFTDPDGTCYQARACIDFIRQTLIPFCRKNKIRLNEIVSDYRQPRSGTSMVHCEPGTPGFLSIIPEDIKDLRVWVKCMHSPVWVRKNGGIAGKKAGFPYPDPDSFGQWLKSVLGSPDPDKPVILTGVTLDCCVLCVAQELFFQGYQVRFLREGVDTYSGSQREKEALFNSPLSNWGKPISWQELLSNNGEEL